MLLSKANLLVSSVADRGGLVHIESDGTTVAVNAEGTVMAVSPMESSHAPLSVNLRKEFSAKVLKFLGLKPDGAILVEVDSEGRLFAGSSENVIAYDLPDHSVVPEWRSRFERGSSPVRIVNRKELLMLLKAMDTSSPEKGFGGSLFIGIGNDGLHLITENKTTNQTVAGFVEYLPAAPADFRSPWYRRLLGISPKKRKIRHL